MSGPPPSADNAAPPPGPPPLAGFNLPDENHDLEIIVGTAVTTFLALVIVSLRLWVRATKVRSVGGDDYWIVAALVRICWSSVQLSN